MSIRDEVNDLLVAGPFPSEEATEDEIVETERLLERVTRPVSDEEAQALVTVFGPDDCFGLSWSLLHLIETAPGAQEAHYPVIEGNMWAELLNSRVEFGRKLAAEKNRSNGA
ncbi:hypothetical protein [Streptomyces sp. NBC_00038]|uniref:hypothetical protein n=1 Tax=Streptomyces sp. NBC_00038 TaxID=2903615 RepID=UPI00225BD6EE|nr:hypothetical protein [Streptomyces sp. NBC_00038]MCX5560867.1 hypothetical protein [Streptomyces sp. NBC_00038]